MSKPSTSSSISTAADVKAAKPHELKALCDAENISYAGVVERPELNKVAEQALEESGKREEKDSSAPLKRQQVSRQHVETPIEDVSWVPLDDKTGRGINFSGQWVMESDTADKDIHDLRVTAILSFYRPGNKPFRTPAGVVEHAQLAANEEDADRIMNHFDAICDFIDNLQHGREVLIHCEGGVCRAPIAVMAYLAWRQRHDGWTSYAKVRGTSRSWSKRSLAA